MMSDSAFEKIRHRLPRMTAPAVDVPKGFAYSDIPSGEISVGEVRFECEGVKVTLVEATVVNYIDDEGRRCSKVRGRLESGEWRAYKFTNVVMTGVRLETGDKGDD